MQERVDKCKLQMQHQKSTQTGAEGTFAYNEIFDRLGIKAGTGDRSKDVGGANGDQVNALLTAKVPGSSLSLNLHSRKRQPQPPMKKKAFPRWSQA